MASEPELHITPLYVLARLEKHEETCAKRWWTVMLAVISNLVLLMIGMGGVIITLLSRTAH